MSAHSTTAATPPAADAGATAGPSVRTALLAAAHAELAEHGAGGVSLRAVARRAGVSHAAPKHHFDDRAGLLTAVAVEGFQDLTDALHRADTDGDGVAPVDLTARIGALGRAYLDFGLAHPDLFELMFSSGQLHRDDPVLSVAQRESFGVLAGALEHVADDAAFQGDAAFFRTDAPLMGWVFVHGLVVLVRDGALRSVSAAESTSEAAAVAHRLTDTFTALMRAAARS